ncbi:MULTISPECIES: peptidoglycan-binding protein [unclassified Rhizobium]|jgi:localization factor PodJL|uniref:peptidoglycan-binding protein n=1 Tax=unclassified Rhizobium TaxID=2613769 RepID=UPI00064772E0|nr:MULTISPECIES: peptidoglycan-binding protein [unclassified Rhizobium]MBN8950122.1 SEL1-like repeat protein [Rhizobium tropici]OJY62525.1 MAG: hemagglutinin [Rhizobium sp. 60-20]RKD74582.1 localization factor PodJL [Rhizobium sp. WW_1]
MSGSRSNPTGTGDWTSLDALSRTIEGLEARIEGLMGTAAARDTRQRVGASYAPAPERAAPERMPPRPEREQPASRAYERPLRSERQDIDPRPDPLAEIRQRQRALEANRERLHARREEIAHAEPQPARRPIDSYPQRQPARAAAAEAPVDIAQALVNLRQDLKRDIAESVTREVTALRAEIRDIRENAEDKHFVADVRQDMARLADSINQLAGQPETAGLKTEFDELRSLMDGLAREESLHHVERQVRAIDTSGLQDELVSLAYRLDDIKQHLGGMNDSPAVHALETKLLTIATAMESLGSMMQPQDQAMQRLEGRLSGLADQIDVMSRDAARRQPADDLSGRLEALAMRIDELGSAKAVARLEERLDQLSHLMERSQKAAPQPELVTYLADISHKIDALEHGSVGNVMADRLDYLARRIDEMDFHPPAQAAGIDDSMVRRLEGRLSDIAARLEASTAAPPTDTQALRNLEEQIAHLSTLLTNEPRAVADHLPPDFDRRMSAIEDYMATNDEYIIEAARHAAETVVEAYSREGGMGHGAQAADMAALTALADDLRHLEDLSRASDERTHRTFEALHDTLLQIADRLDHMEHRRPAPAMPAAPFESDVFADEELPALKPPMAAQQKAGPIIRTVAPAEAPVSAEVAVAQAIDANTKAEIKAAAKKSGKTSLFASLGKRFFTPEKAEPIFPPDRPVIEPAPSIDPADVVPGEEANELLEPGSGAPDIKKILERVRASQNTSRSGNARQPTENERADYIAAARRAAQAAAMEVDQTQRSAPASKKDTKQGGVFSRFRRPILLAIGAVMLAVMAFPLANTLTRGQKAPPPAEVSTTVAPSDSAASNTVAANAKPAVTDQQAVASQAAAPAASATQPAEVQPAAASADPAAAPVSDHLTAAAPLGGNPAATETLTPAGGTAPAQQTAAFVQTDKPATAAPVAAPAATEITVPDGIQPPSLVAAAKTADPVALFEIGARYTDGRGVPADMKQAAAWYQLSADKGYAPAQYRLASMYEKGNGVDHDLAKAKQYYEQAANQGNASAMHNLAVLYASGTAGSQDYDSAASWFSRAADLGVSDSQFNLAILYARGNGVKQDLQESYKWFAIAAKSGDKDAAQKRDEVANAMKPADLEGARAKVDLWKAQQADPKTNGTDIPDEWTTGKGVNTASIDMKKAIRNIQAILNKNGFDAGTPDGAMGDKTVAALKSFQKSVGLPADGRVTDQVVKELLARNK